jgi:predicted dehydrogenase
LERMLPKDLNERMTAGVSPDVVGLAPQGFFNALDAGLGYDMTEIKKHNFDIQRGIPGKGGWFTTKELSGGGPLIDLSVHFIDLAVWLMGNPKPIAVSGAIYSKFAGSELSDSAYSEFGDKQAEGIFDVEDLAIGFIRFENGASLQLKSLRRQNHLGGHSLLTLMGQNTEMLTSFWTGTAPGCIRHICGTHGRSSWGPDSRHGRLSP